MTEQQSEEQWLEQLADKICELEYDLHVKLIGLANEATNEQLEQAIKKLPLYLPYGRVEAIVTFKHVLRCRGHIKRAKELGAIVYCPAHRCDSKDCPESCGLKNP